MWARALTCCVGNVHAAPMLMSALQFSGQIVMAHAVLRSGLVKRKKPSALSWQQYFIQGAPPCLPSCLLPLPVRPRTQCSLVCCFISMQLPAPVVLCLHPCPCTLGHASSRYRGMQLMPVGSACVPWAVAACTCGQPCV